MARFVPVPDLNEKVAVMIAPEVRKVAERVQLHAKALAPAAKKWVSMSDHLVRDTHREAHGQTVPENLRFKVRGQPWDIEHGLSPGVDYLLRPKDTSTGLPIDSVQHVHCRCVAALLPTAIAEAVVVGPTKVYGTEVEVVVSCTYFQIVQCEFGDTYPTGVSAPGTHFMGRAAARAAGNGGYGPGGGNGLSGRVGRSDGGAGDE